MWNRKEIKSRGRERFMTGYWKGVLTALIIGMVGGGVGITSGAFSWLGGATGSNSERPDLSGYDHQMLITIAIIIAIISLIVFAVSAAVKIFVYNPLYYGCKEYYLRNSEGNASLNTLGHGFKNYSGVVSGLFFRDLFIWLWSLLFVIPGIIKSYSYRMVPYIIADNPEISGTEAVTRSRKMMNGHKWRTFVLDLSFLPWDLLSAVTFGMVGTFYSEPYKLATDAELYQRIKAGEQEQY